MADDYAHRRREGLRLALAILETEGAKWSALLGGSVTWRMRMSRVVRHKAFQVAQKRIRTALNRETPNSEATIDPEVAAALERVGL